MKIKKSSYSASKIRIIGGQWRGRKLTVLNSLHVRPTPNRVRETLFNWLTPVINGATCLDCFAGSGALGLEALSRQAANVILLEKNRAASVQLGKTLELLKTKKAKIFHTNSLLWLNQPGNAYDVVFIDPPFRQDMINKTINLLERHHRLMPTAWIYIETEIKNSAFNVPKHWQLQRANVAGQVEYHL